MQCKSGDLPSYGVKTGEDDSLGCVVYDYLDACGSLKSTYIAPLASDDASFYLIVVDMEYSDGVFHCRLRCHTLNRLDDDFLSLS